MSFLKLIACEEWGIAHIRQSCVELVDLTHPFAKGLRGGERVFHLLIVVEAAFGHVHGDHLTWAKRAFFAHCRLICWYHAHFGAGDQLTVAGDDIAHGPQSIAIQSTADPATIGHRQCCRAVPWLHDGVAIGIHVAPRLGQLVGLFRPAFWHHHCFGHWGIAARANQHFEHGIQCGGVRGSTWNDRFDIFGHIAKGRGGHANFVALHPVCVAFECIDLAVVGEHAERLCQPPLRERIG